MLKESYYTWEVPDHNVKLEAKVILSLWEGLQKASEKKKTQTNTSTSAVCLDARKYNQWNKLKDGLLLSVCFFFFFSSKQKAHIIFLTTVLRAQIRNWWPILSSHNVFPSWTMYILRRYKISVPKNCTMTFVKYVGISEFK